MQKITRCWCGNDQLSVFSDEYAVCTACGTLVSQVGLSAEKTLVVDDSQDFYGKEYWLSHQSADLGFPSIRERARLDLPERDVHWLRTVLKYKLPPAAILELGSAHGGFVALLRQAGYDATGLEMSPWVVEFARQTFDVPMLVGPLEEQKIEPGSLDVIALMDVLEHLPDPLRTMRHALELLKPGGVLVIQVPSYPEGKTYEAMVAENSPFLQQLKADEHLYLFSQRSVREFFARLGAPYLNFEPAIFAHYDMFLVVSRVPLGLPSQLEVESALSSTPGRRMVQALLDAREQIEQLGRRLEESEADREARLEIIRQVGQRLQVSEEDREARLQVIHRISGELEAYGRWESEVRTILARPVAGVLRRLGLIRKLPASPWKTPKPVDE